MQSCSGRQGTGDRRDVLKALWLEDRRLTIRADVPVPEPPDGEALVRVLRAGICNTDLELVRGYYPYAGIPGHEFVGVVENGPSALVGRRVVGEINAVCGECGACRAGRPTHCERRTVLGIVKRNGAFADYLTLPIANLHFVPDGISTDAATFTEPLAAALEIQEQVAVRAGDRVLVVGDGKLGQLIAQTMGLTGCDLLVVGRHAAKLELLSARGIPTGTVEAVRPGAYDVTVECTGNPEGFALS
ncbi:MAG: alcohol dehydrogenase catalytic domain-containing protein, partial [Gemmatimonadales bacterium]|nr:alcohol dehydrogenase catalytic domain-containing protein [Gemmatimonadales bacterium]